MTENLKETKNKAPTQPKKVDKQLTTLQGFTTSRVEQALKGSKTHGQHPYPARVFLKVEGQKEDTPIIFRIRCPNWLKTSSCCEWEKPKIKRGSRLTLRGIFEKSLKSNRLSFTTYSYQILEEDYLAKKEILNQAKNKLPEFEQAYQQIKATREYLESHGGK